MSIIADFQLSLLSAMADYEAAQGSIYSGTELRFTICTYVCNKETIYIVKPSDILAYQDYKQAMQGNLTPPDF